MLTSLAPSPIAKVMESFTLALTIRTTSAFCEGDTLDMNTSKKVTFMYRVASCTYIPTADDRLASQCEFQEALLNSSVKSECQSLPINDDSCLQ